MQEKTQWFDSIDDLAKNLKTHNAADIRSMDSDSVDVVRRLAEEVLKKHVQADVYDAYSPKHKGWVSTSPSGEIRRATYQRRYDLLNVKSVIQSDGTLLVTSDSSVRDPIVRGSSFSDHGDPAGSFFRLIESDSHGLWRGGFSRPVIQNAQKEVDSKAFWDRVNKELE